MGGHFVLELIKYLLKGLVWLAENFPDDPRLAKRLLLIGAMLSSAIFLPVGPAGYEDVALVARYALLFCGAICGILGAFVFFRRFVWWRQEKAGSGLVNLDLSSKRNISGGNGVSSGSEPVERSFSDDWFD